MGFNSVCVDRESSTFSSNPDERVFLCPTQDAEKVRQRRSRVAQRLAGISRSPRFILPANGYTKCGGYLLGPSLAAALPAERRVLGRRGCLADSGWAGGISAWVGRVRTIAFLSILLNVERLDVM